MGLEEFLHGFGIAAVGFGEGEVVKEFRGADIESAVTFAAGFLSKGAGEKGFADPRGSDDDHILVFFDPIAGEEIHHDAFIDSAGRFVVDIFGTGIHFEFGFFE